ncbi:uncharacterized protein K444DRAFT_637431 [Hyaloscypha bicolor E]|uniref:Uncharacterized protein n=1 Tax=Hyaloscypha bicolor E TaxID=1095630 RepID=A0A2J6SNA7_9HELO|nr:uncharacterized protein K444DRAFT_637431 [Hyaloscypha bicolor E]PMD52244.1 hypothetical protein K444DRAFT_637431 [Hyaloscypha bicolor E]
MSTNPTYPVDPREMLKNSTLGVKVCASLMNICGHLEYLQKQGFYSEQQREFLDRAVLKFPNTETLVDSFFKSTLQLQSIGFTFVDTPKGPKVTFEEPVAVPSSVSCSEEVSIKVEDDSNAATDAADFTETEDDAKAASNAEESTDGDDNAKTTLLPDGCQLHMSMWAPENYKKRIAMAAKPVAVVAKPAHVVTKPAHVVTKPVPVVAKSVPVAAKVVKFAQNASRNGIKISPATCPTKARCYSPDELLHLRSSLPAINGVASKFKNSPHIARMETAISYTEKKARGHEEVAVSHDSKAGAFIRSGAVDFKSRSSLQWLWGVCSN